LFIPAWVIIVGGDIKFEEGVVTEEDAGGFIIGPDFICDIGVFIFDEVEGFFGDHFKSGSP